MSAKLQPRRPLPASLIATSGEVGVAAQVLNQGQKKGLSSIPLGAGIISFVSSDKEKIGIPAKN
jgi:hypothetical protein